MLWQVLKMLSFLRRQGTPMSLWGHAYNCLKSEQVGWGGRESSKKISARRRSAPAALLGRPLGAGATQCPAECLVDLTGPARPGCLRLGWLDCLPSPGLPGWLAGSSFLFAFSHRLPLGPPRAAVRCAPASLASPRQSRHRLNGSLAQRVPSLSLSSSSRIVLDHAVLKGMFPWRTRYPWS